MGVVGCGSCWVGGGGWVLVQKETWNLATRSKMETGGGEVDDGLQVGNQQIKEKVRAT